MQLGIEIHAHSTHMRRQLAWAALALAVVAGVPPFCLGETFWTTGKALMPGWGFYPNGETYGGTKSLDEYSAWRAGRLIWVAEFPADADYTIFVRRYAGSGHVKVTIDEGVPVNGGKGWTPIDNQSNVRYRWDHVGQAHVTK